MRIALLLVLTALTGCNEMPGQLSEERVTAIAAQQAVAANQTAEGRIDKLENENRELQHELSVLTKWVRAESESLDSLRRTFNQNVVIDNNAKVARMTAAGACGTERVTFPEGGWTVRNKECTLKDLR